MKKPATALRKTKAQRENQAAEDMWTYYRDHKAQIVSNVKKYRDFILDALIQGQPVAQVFAPFMRSS